MNAPAISSDGLRIHYELTGHGKTALLFSHGWLGNTRWWDAQVRAFAGHYQVVTLDLAGHGKSDKTRKVNSAEHYAEDLHAVAERIEADKIVLIGHSMSGAYALEAFPKIPRIAAIVLVDTLRDLDELVSPEESEKLFALYRKDFHGAIKKVLPGFLFAKTSPAEIRERVLGEFLQVKDADFAISLLEPLYQMDVREAAKRVTVPVRAINSDLTPTSLANNRKYLRDFDCKILPFVGHYPMLEDPERFNQLLTNIVAAALP